ncbi:hypothetical protein IAT38_004401 [Cryptococcus sp. DSM 104549]
MRLALRLTPHRTLSRSSRLPPIHRPLHTAPLLLSQSPSYTPVQGATDLSHAHFISNASANSDFNPAQTPHAGQDLPSGLTSHWQGKLTPTTSHLFKLIIPLPAPSKAGSGGNTASNPEPRPTAFLLHPSQPLSHLSRLIAGSLPPSYAHSDITYLALTGHESDVDSHLRNAEERRLKSSEDGSDPDAPRNVEDFSGRDEGGPLLHERSDDKGRWQEVSWSQSTDLSDFIKQSCLNEKFKIVISPDVEASDERGAAQEGGSASEGVAEGERKGKEKKQQELVLEVFIPSFASRTHYIRKRLLSLTKDLDRLTKQKKEIDYKAHKGAQRLAVVALGGGVAYWGTVIRFTFFTDAGWDMMEPVTWATGFAALLSSAAFLIYHNREVSYSSLLDLSITARQRKLYSQAGLDLEHWTEMVAEAKALRKEIERIAADYDIEWKGELEGLEAVGKAAVDGENSPRTGIPGVEVGEKKSDVQEHVPPEGKKVNDPLPPSSSSPPGEDSAGKENAQDDQHNEEGEKIDIDKTIDEAAELASQSEGQQSKEKAAQRTDKVVGSDDDQGSRARKGEGKESSSEMRGRARAQEVINGGKDDQ